MIKTLSFVIALSLLCTISKTQVSQKYLIEAGKLYDATQGVFLKDMVILVDGKTIISVAEKRSVSEIERKNRTIINLSNYTVLPGLIDAHTHFGSDDYLDLGQPLAAMSKSTLIGYSEEGMTIPQILTAATVNAAKHVNRSNDLGRISKGYLADIIAVDNDLEKNIKAVLNIHFVMKDGTVFVGPKP